MQLSSEGLLHAAMANLCRTPQHSMGPLTKVLHAAQHSRASGQFTRPPYNSASRKADSHSDEDTDPEGGVDPEGVKKQTRGRAYARGGHRTLPRSFLGTMPCSALGGIHSSVCQSPYSFVISIAAAVFLFLAMKGSSSSCSPKHLYREVSFSTHLLRYLLTKSKGAEVLHQGMQRTAHPIMHLCVQAAEQESHPSLQLTIPASFEQQQAAATEAAQCTSASSSAARLLSAGSSLLPRFRTSLAGVLSSEGFTARPCRSHMSACSSHMPLRRALADS